MPMRQRLIKALFSIIVLVNIQGCAVLLAGAAASAGTAVWLSGKLTQEFRVPFDRGIDAAKSALKALKLDVEKETYTTSSAQIISSYKSGDKIWIDIHFISDSLTRVEVRVGIPGDKDAASIILQKIGKNI
jgi:hypothetical protein